MWDKAAHFLIGLLISLAPVPADNARDLSIAAGVGKEIHDAAKYSSASIGDAGATILGGLLGHHLRQSSRSNSAKIPSGLKEKTIHAKPQKTVPTIPTATPLLEKSYQRDFKYAIENTNAHKKISVLHTYRDKMKERNKNKSSKGMGFGRCAL